MVRRSYGASWAGFPTKIVVKLKLRGDWIPLVRRDSSTWLRTSMSKLRRRDVRGLRRGLPGDVDERQVGVEEDVDGLERADDRTVVLLGDRAGVDERHAAEPGLDAAEVVHVGDDRGSADGLAGAGVLRDDGVAGVVGDGDVDAAVREVGAGLAPGVGQGLPAEPAIGAADLDGVGAGRAARRSAARAYWKSAMVRAPST